MAIFNSAPNIAGYYQSFKGGNAVITLSRQGSTTTADAKGGHGFMVSSYQVTFQRSVVLQRFLNMTDSAAIVGAGTGQAQLTGLVGTLDAFEELITGSTSGEEDICKALTMTINDSGGFTKCDGGTAKSSESIECSNAIVTGIQLTGQIDANGVVMQTANLTLTFSTLEFK